MQASSSSISSGTKAETRGNNTDVIATLAKAGILLDIPYLVFDIDVQKQGGTALEILCGSGSEALLAAHEAGSSGKIVGLDTSEACPTKLDCAHTLISTLQLGDDRTGTPKRK